MIKKISIWMLAVFTTAGLALPVWAAPNFITGDKDQAVTIDAPLTDDTYIGANTAMVNSDIGGDLIVGANTAQINGRVGGDLWVGAGTVTINDRITGDVRVGAGEVTINTTVDDDVIIGTGKLTVGEKAVIRGDLIVGSGDATINGRVYGNVRVAGGAVTIKANISGNVEVKTDNYLTILPGTKIAGELTYWAPKANPEFTQYAKKVTYHSTAKRSSVPLLGAMMWMIPAMSVSLLLWKLICVLLLGAVLIYLMPKLLPRIVGLTRKNYWQSFWQGLIFTIGVPILMLILAMTLIGIQLTVLLGLIYGLVMILGYASTAMLTGSWLVKKFDKTPGRQLMTLMVGSILFGLIGIVPVIGWLICFGLMMIGVGGFWQDRYKMFRAGRY